MRTRRLTIPVILALIASLLAWWSFALSQPPDPLESLDPDEGLALLVSPEPATSTVEIDLSWRVYLWGPESLMIPSASLAVDVDAQEGSGPASADVYLVASPRLGGIISDTFGCPLGQQELDDVGSLVDLFVDLEGVQPGRGLVIFEVSDVLSDSEGATTSCFLPPGSVASEAGGITAVNLPMVILEVSGDDIEPRSRYSVDVFAPATTIRRSERVATPAWESQNPSEIKDFHVSGGSTSETFSAQPDGNVAGLAAPPFQGLYESATHSSGQARRAFYSASMLVLAGVVLTLLVDYLLLRPARSRTRGGFGGDLEQVRVDRSG